MLSTTFVMPDSHTFTKLTNIYEDVVYELLHIGFSSGIFAQIDLNTVSVGNSYAYDFSGCSGSGIHAVWGDQYHTYVVSTCSASIWYVDADFDNNLLVRKSI